MRSFVIYVIAGNLIEIVYVPCGGKGARKGEKSHVSSDTYIGVELVLASEVGAASKVASIVQGIDVGVACSRYHEVGVGVTQEEKADLSRATEVIADDQARIIDRIHVRATGLSVRMDYYGEGAVAGPNKSLAGEVGDVKGGPGDIAGAVYFLRASLDILVGVHLKPGDQRDRGYSRLSR